jgi:hypothetical protein
MVATSWSQLAPSWPPNAPVGPSWPPVGPRLTLAHALGKIQ